MFRQEAPPPPLSPPPPPPPKNIPVRLYGSRKHLENSFTSSARVYDDVDVYVLGQNGLYARIIQQKI